MTNIILVDKKDNPIGEIEKLSAHLGDGKLHRAISVILQNNKGEVLLTQRALKKPLWPTFWANTYCSHPNVGESLEQVCIRRAKEELGIEVKDFQELFTIKYQARWNEFFSENEIDHVFLAKYNGKLKLPQSNDRENLKSASSGLKSSEEKFPSASSDQPKRLIGEFREGGLSLNPDEISDYKWLSWQEVFAWVEKEPGIMVPWWILTVEKIKKDKLD